ncbi:hypothetical protein Gotri_003457 [Gossypium trilobum]|uniref:Uncharacterized protein n=1 Tax=Gossypium trilobum TaxID=34281 RepID=A0A7J9F1K3_9ROSI|nr:hypothetical protein [Gossypium trilobum]
MMFRCVFQGSISMQDCLMERRPYHRNCQCALHCTTSKGFVYLLVLLGQPIYHSLRNSHGLLFLVFVSFRILFSSS